MIKITRTQEPNCLTQLKNNPTPTYNDLQGECRKIVQNQLKSDQRGLCAYCQRKFESKVFIEHYLPQSTTPNRQLDYDNFFGTCSGKYYLDKKTGKSIVFCNPYRGNKTLTIDPVQQADIDTLFYDDDNKICSSNSIFDTELDKVLNLNFEELCFEREYAFEQEEEAFIELAIEMNMNPLQIYSKALKSIEARNPPYSGFLLYRFTQKLNFYSTKTK